MRNVASTRRNAARRFVDHAGGALGPPTRDGTMITIMIRGFLTLIPARTRREDTIRITIGPTSVTTIVNVIVERTAVALTRRIEMLDGRFPEGGALTMTRLVVTTSLMGLGPTRGPETVLESRVLRGTIETELREEVLTLFTNGATSRRP